MNMQTCCIKGCDSHKYIGEKTIGYFPFPVHDEILLKKWLTQLNQPNWKPGAYHQICSMHFRGEDVDSHPNRKQPFLNPTSIPTIFPGQANKKNANSDQNQALQVVNVNSNGICNISAPQPTSVILIPTQIATQNPMQFPLRHIVQISASYPAQISEQNMSDLQDSATLTALPTESQCPMPIEELATACKTLNQRSPVSPQSKLRKILPKPPDYFPIPTFETFAAVPQYLRAMPAAKLDVQSVSVVGNAEETNASSPTVKKTAPHPDNKRPILQISVNKHQRTEDAPDSSARASNDKATNRSRDEAEKNESRDFASSSKEITIKNPSTNRTVTFRLDPKTGEIVATTQRMRDSSNEEEDIKPTRKKRKVDDTREQPSAAKLRQLYLKSQRECNALRKRLKVLRQRHKEEQEEIERLEEHLIQIGIRVRKACPKDVVKSGSAQPKEAKDIVQSSNDNNYENIMREVNTMKENIRNRKNEMSPITNGQCEAQKCFPTLTGKNVDLELLENNQAFEKSSDREIIRTTNDKCSEVVKTIEENLINLNPKLGSDDEVFKEEFLYAEFLLE